MNEIIENLEEKLRQAMLASDVVMLEQLIADDLIFTVPTGDVLTKEMDLEAHRSGVQKISHLELLKRTIRYHKHFAIVAAKMKLEGRYNDVSIDGSYSYTRVWAQVGDSWKVVGGQASLIQS